VTIYNTNRHCGRFGIKHDWKLNTELYPEPNYAVRTLSCYCFKNTFSSILTHEYKLMRHAKEAILSSLRAQYANMLGGGVIVESINDLKRTIRL
jgi:hypothetical protein